MGVEDFDMKKLVYVGCALLSSSVWAVPEITDIGMVRSNGGSYAISYRLTGGPAVVTLDIVTNGVSVGRAGLGIPVGEANAWVEDGLHRIKWCPANTLRVAGIESINAKAVLTAWTPNRMPDYLVCDLTGGDRPRYFVNEADLPGDSGAQGDVYKTEKLLLKFVRARDVAWPMGASTNEAGFIGWNVEKNAQVVGNQGGEPLRQVMLKRNYYLGVYEVTQEQWRRVTGTNPSAFATADDSAKRPVGNVSYNMLRVSTGSGWPSGGHATVGDFALAKFRAKASLALDLPTEAQWEYACRAGSGSPFAGNRTISGVAAAAKGEGDATVVPELDDLARYAGNGTETAVVGSYAPNAWGFYDLHGNVQEWVLDFCNPWPAADGLVVDPTGGTGAEAFAGTTRVLKGGAYNSSARRCRSAARRFNVPNGAQPSFGFRLCWTVEEAN